jgi:hypothetical protein
VQGVILEELQQYVVQKFGFGTWMQVLKKTGRPPDQRYLLDQVYPDEELSVLAIHTAAVTQKPVQDVLEEFGEAMTPDMLNFYGQFVDLSWTLSDFLFNMERLLHAALQLHAADAQPAKINVVRSAPHTINVSYDSPLRACAAVRGVIRGAAKHYHVEVTLTDEQCVLRGDPLCVIEVKGPLD